MLHRQFILVIIPFEIGCKITHFSANGKKYFPMSGKVRIFAV